MLEAYFQRESKVNVKPFEEPLTATLPTPSVTSNERVDELTITKKKTLKKA